MRLEQKWNMFSRPLSEDGWYECSGQLRGGKYREEEEEGDIILLQSHGSCFYISSVFFFSKRSYESPLKF